MRDVHIELLRAVETAVTALAEQGDAVNVEVHTIGMKFPDGSNVTFSAVTTETERDWEITTGGSTA